MRVVYELNLDRIMEEQGITVADLQDRIRAANGKATNVRAWMKNQVWPRGTQIVMLADVLGVDPGLLFRVKDEVQPVA